MVFQWDCNTLVSNQFLTKPPGKQEGFGIPLLSSVFHALFVLFSVDLLDRPPYSGVNKRRSLFRPTSSSFSTSSSVCIHHNPQQIVVTGFLFFTLLVGRFFFPPVPSFCWTVGTRKPFFFGKQPNPFYRFRTHSTFLGFFFSFFCVPFFYGAISCF